VALHCVLSANVTLSCQHVITLFTTQQFLLFLITEIQDKMGENRAVGSVLTATGLISRKGQYLTLQNQHATVDRQKLVTGLDVGDLYNIPLRNWCKSVNGGFSANG